LPALSSPPQPQELLSAHQYATVPGGHDAQFDLQHVVDAEAVDAAVSETPRPTKSVVPSRFRKREGAPRPVRYRGRRRGVAQPG
jgi:hypothetical protein